MNKPSQTLFCSSLLNEVEEIKTRTLAKLLLHLEWVKRTWSALTVLWLNVLLILCWCYKGTFLDTITNTCFTSSSPCSALFPCFITTSPESLWHHGQNTKKLSVLHTGHGKNACGLQSFLSLIVFITHCSVLEKKEKKRVSPRYKDVVY